MNQNFKTKKYQNGLYAQEKVTFDKDQSQEREIQKKFPIEDESLPGSEIFHCPVGSKTYNQA